MERKTLIGKGFLPKELPPLFTSESFAEFIEEGNFASLPQKSKNTVPISHNLARPGNLRRKLQIPNPLNFYELATSVSRNWETISAHLSRSPFSMSKPVADPRGRRALIPEKLGNALMERRAQVRAAGRFVLRTDVTRFYPSIYTHAIPWAFDGKGHAKINRTGGIGNELDRLVRSAQDGQTVGIPVGPDTSLIIAEAITAAIDVDLSRYGFRGLRFMDDYEFVFESKSQAEAALERIETCLSSYELAINPRKTRIDQLPIELDYAWRSPLADYNFPQGKVTRRFILNFFNLLFRLHRDNPFEPLIPYGIACLRSLDLDPDTWPVLRDLLCQCLLVDPSCIRPTFQLIEKNDEFQPGEIVGDVLNKIIGSHVGLGHGSEIAWALWVAVKLGVNINEMVVSELGRSEDPIVRLSALRARAEGHISNGDDFNDWATSLSADNLYGDQWLFAYEVNIHEWLPITEDHVAKDEYFSLLKDKNVSFLNLDEDELPAEGDWDPYGSTADEGEENRDFSGIEDEFDGDDF